MIELVIRKYNFYIITALLIETAIIVAVYYKPTQKHFLPITAEQESIQNRNKLFYNTPTQNIQGNVTKSISLENVFKDSGLVNIHDIDQTIVVKLKYSTTDNFTSIDLYGDLENAYLQKDVALKLAKANQLLKEKFPFYSILVYDAVRPISVQQKMWEFAKIPAGEKILYLSNPIGGSIHNYGAAVDVSIVNEDGWEVDMGTSYDYFGELGFPISEDKMIEQGRLTYRQRENRKLLREVMYKAGFTGIETEWWHFNACGRNEAKSKYCIIN